MPYLYQNAPLSIPDRVADLLTRMTIEEKIAQLHGLSYTTFSYDHLRLSPSQIAVGQQTTVAVDVSNCGGRAGEEIVQLYVHDQLASVTRPVKELRGFQRVALEPGKTRTVEFTIWPEHLSFLDASMARVVEPGLFDVMVGGSSAVVETVVLEVIAAG